MTLPPGPPKAKITDLLPLDIARLFVVWGMLFVPDKKLTLKEDVTAPLQQAIRDGLIIDLHARRDLEGYGEKWYASN